MIKTTKDSDKGELHIDLSNGHAKAFEQILNDYNIKSEDDLVEFMLSVLSKAEGKKIETNGSTYVPSKSILKENADTTEQPTQK